MSQKSVTMTALISRINRRLRPDHETLKVTRGERLRQNVGDFYVIDVNRNIVVEPHADPERLGRELAVLKSYEEVANGF